LPSLVNNACVKPASGGIASAGGSSATMEQPTSTSVSERASLSSTSSQFAAQTLVSANVLPSSISGEHLQQTLSPSLPESLSLGSASPPDEVTQLIPLSAQNTASQPLITCVVSYVWLQCLLSVIRRLRVLSSSSSSTHESVVVMSSGSTAADSVTGTSILKTQTWLANRHSS
jgi:hypothetical protein